MLSKDEMAEVESRNMVLSLINNHKSIRKYSDKPIAKETLSDILHAGARASTTGNMQVYSMIVTSDAELKDRLFAAHFNQEMVRQAPLIITFCADFNRFTKWCRNRDAVPGYDNYLSFFTAAIDALLVAQNVCLAAESHGLGICYLGTTTYMADSIIETLKLPKFVVPVTSLVVGYPDESPELTDRLPINAVVHYEQYSDYTDDEIEDIYRSREQSKLTKKLIDENNTQTLAQIFTDKRYRKQANVAFSKSFIKVLEKQGFMNNV